MSQELELAATIQKTLFPPPYASYQGASIAGFYLPATECAGDWWYHSIVGDKMHIWIGDVEGHGVPSAMVTSAVRASISYLERVQLSPGEILCELSKLVFTFAIERKLMTFFFASVDLKTGEMTYSSAAHEKPYLLRAQTEPYRPEDVTPLPSQPSIPLGQDISFEFKESKVQLSRGDRVIFYTDGILDVMNPSGEKWCSKQLHRTLVRFLDAPTGALALVKSVESSIQDFRKSAELIDDLTLVAFQY